MDEHVGGAHETFRGTAKKFVEETIAFAKQTFFLFFVPGLEQQRRECGRKSESVEGGNQNGDRNGYGELLVQPASDTGNERSRYEHRGKNQRDGHYRAADFFHGFYGGGLGVHAFVDVVLHSFHNDDGVVDDQANGQHQAKERQRVNRESECWENDDCSDERTRNSQQRNERAAPTLKE